MIGRNIADEIYANLKDRISKRAGTPVLVVLRIGEDKGSIYYEKALIRQGEKLGVKVCPIHFDADKYRTQDICGYIRRSINQDFNVDGVLLLQPVPKEIDVKAIKDAIAPWKDLDCVNEVNLKKVYNGEDVMAPCTAEACIRMLDYYGVEIEGNSVTILGRSETVGKPLAAMLLKRNAMVTVAHSKIHKQVIADSCYFSDIIITAVGKPNTLTRDMLCYSMHSTVIDVGINQDENGKLVGDCAEGVENGANMFTPVPGGVGEVTTAILFEHLVDVWAGKE